MRLPSTSDRRTTFVELTEKGVEVCQRVIPAVARYSMAVCDRLDGTARASFVSMLKALSRRAERAATEDFGPG